MTIDRKIFFDAVRGSVFGGRLARGQVEGMEAILDAFEAQLPEGDRRWLAYMLATACHETGAAMQPVRETKAVSDAEAIRILDRAFAAGRLPWVKRPYWHRDADGKSWLGRGFVQITHKDNYRRLGDAIGIDLVADPDAALRLDVALQIMMAGMVRGLFTSKALADYFSPSRTDWGNARRIINGVESAAKVAGIARAFQAAIRQSAA